MNRERIIQITSLVFLLAGSLPATLAEVPSTPPTSHLAPDSARLKIQSASNSAPLEKTFVIPQPAHASKPDNKTPPSGFHVSPARNSTILPPRELPSSAEYLLPDRKEKPPLVPEDANLNLPTELELKITKTGETVVLPAGTYRQILQLPMDSPLMETANQTRETRGRPAAREKEMEISRYAEGEKKPLWVRYESLEKIKIGGAERRGGIDLPSHGPKGLGPRVWYAKAETADVASSVFYFIFGGLGYSTANLAGWTTGNTCEIPGDFEYRLIRR